MLNQFTTTTLDDVCIRITDGAHHSPKTVENGFPMASVKDLTTFGINLDTCRLISREDFATLVRQGCKPEINDVLIAKDGNSALETVCLVTDESEVVLLSSVAILRPNPNLVVPGYLRYYLEAPSTRRYLKNYVTGAAIPRVILKDFKQAQIKIPSIDIQTQIARILSTLDALIENNQHRMNLLEQTARDLYHEWFIKLRFPDHEFVEINYTVDGNLPNGWNYISIQEALSYHIGGGWGEESQSEEYSVPAHVIRGTDIPEAQKGNVAGLPLRFHRPSNVNSRKLSVGDLVLEVSGGSKGQPVGRPLLISERLLSSLEHSTICASFCKLIRPDVTKVSPELLYLHLKRIYDTGLIEKYQLQSTGIVNFKFAFFLSDNKIIVPSNEIKSQFTQLVKPMMSQIDVLGQKNLLLRQLRDLLLPQLISGELDVTRVSIGGVE